MLFIAALASSVVLSTPTVLPASSFFASAIPSTNWNTSSNTSSGSRWRVLVSVEWSGVRSSSGMPRNCRSDRLSAHRHYGSQAFLRVPSHHHRNSLRLLNHAPCKLAGYPVYLKNFFYCGWFLCGLPG